MGFKLILPRLGSLSPGLLELSKDGPSALLKWCNLSYSEPLGGWGFYFRIET